MKEKKQSNWSIWDKLYALYCVYSMEFQMSKYGEKYGGTACLAAEKAREGMAPRQAWKESAKKFFPDSSTSRDKPCPRCTFLGLASAGLIVGIPSGKYTESQCSMEHALAGVNLLRDEPNLCTNPSEMWLRIDCDKPDTHNQQMHVVASLWRGGYIKSED